MKHRRQTAVRKWRHHAASMHESRAYRDRMQHIIIADKHKSLSSPVSDSVICRQILAEPHQLSLRRSADKFTRTQTYRI